MSTRAKLKRKVALQEQDWILLLINEHLVMDTIWKKRSIRLAVIAVNV